jgi:hypothetical protein
VLDGLYCVIFQIIHDPDLIVTGVEGQEEASTSCNCRKKVLSEMDQVHVLEGLISGDKVQKASLAEQIGSIDFQLFRHAVHCVSKQIER